MTALRPLSPRPELVIGSPDAASITTITGTTQVGVKGKPLGRERVVFALPLNKDGPQQIRRATVLQGSLVVSPINDVIGVNNAVWVHRLLYAAPVADTRRLAV